MGLEDYYNKISKVSRGIPYYFTRKPGRSQSSFHTKVFLQIWHHKLKGFRDFKGLRSLGWSKAFLKHIIMIVQTCRHVDMQRAHMCSPAPQAAPCRQRAVAPGNLQTRSGQPTTPEGDLTLRCSNIQTYSNTGGVVQICTDHVHLQQNSCEQLK